MDRHDLVRDFFDTHFEYGPDFKAEDNPDAAWDRQADRLHAPFGFSTPELVDGNFRLQYSADVIVAQTAELTEGELDHYLHAVQLHVDQHMTHGPWSDHPMEPDELEQQTDSMIYSLSPPLMELVNRVQMGALST